MQMDPCSDAGEQQQPQCRPRAPLAARVHKVSSRIPSPRPPAKPRVRETLRAWGWQKLPHKDGFCPFALSLSGELRGPCHGAAPTAGSITVELGSSYGMSPPLSPAAPRLLVSAEQTVRPHSQPVSDMGVIRGAWVLESPSRVLGGL